MSMNEIPSVAPRVTPKRVVCINCKTRSDCLLIPRSGCRIQLFCNSCLYDQLRWANQIAFLEETICEKQTSNDPIEPFWFTRIDGPMDSRMNGEVHWHHCY